MNNRSGSTAGQASAPVEARHVMLIGAGGHARVVADVIRRVGWRVTAYVDPQASTWLDADRIGTEELATRIARGDALALGLGGTSPEQLHRRLQLFQEYAAAGARVPALVDPAATLSPSAVIGDGTQVLPGTVVNAYAAIGNAVIVNTRAVVEHEACIGDGVHVGPGAIVLRGVTIGAGVMIGAGAVLLAGANVPAGTLVKAATRFPR